MKFHDLSFCLLIDKLILKLLNNIGFSWSMYVVMIQIISIQCLIIIALFYSSDEQIARQINPLARIAGGFTHPIQLCLKASGSYSGLQHH